MAPLIGGGLVPVTLGLQPRAGLTAPDGVSGSPIFARDGRYVFFVSDARNLVTNALENWGLNLYRWDRESRTTELVSTGMGSYPLGTTVAYSVSADGERAVFSGQATIFMAPPEGNIFLRDIAAGTTTLISRRHWEAGPVPADGPSWNASLSADGLNVVFNSLATDLVAWSGSGNQSLVISYAIETGDSRALAADPSSDSPVEHQVSRDAEVVVFRNPASQYFPGGNGWTSLMVWRRRDATYTRVGLSEPPSEEMSAVWHPLDFSLSADGRRLAFHLDFRGGPNRRGIWIYDVETATAERILPEQPLRQFDQIAWSDDGRRLVVLERRPGIEFQSEVHIWTELSGVRPLSGWIEPPASPPPDPTSISRCEPSPDGRFLVFRTAEAIPVAGAPGDGRQACYLRELATGSTRRLAVEPMGVEPAFSADGRWLAFQSSERRDSLDDNGTSDVFILELPDGTPERVSVGLESGSFATGDGNSWVDGGLSDDGRWIAFSSRASNLVPNDANGRQDVFVHDRLLQTNLLVSVNREGWSAATGARWGRLSGDGRSVLFLSDSPDIVQGVTNRSPNVFLRDLPTGTTRLVSVDPVSAAAMGLKPLNAWVAADGRRVMMEFDAEFPGLPKLLVWDRGISATRDVLQGLTNTFGFPRVHHPGSARFDRNATVVAFSSGFEQEGIVEIRDLASGSLTRVPVQTDSRVVDLSPDGRWLLTRFGPTEKYDPAREVWESTPITYALFDRILGRAMPLEIPSVLATSIPRFAGDSHHLLLVGRELHGGNTAAERQMFLYSLDRGTVVRAGSELGDGAPAFDFSKAQLTPDMRWMIFTSMAAGSDGLDLNETSDVFVHDRYSGVTRLVSAAADGRAGDGPSVGGRLSADGRFFALATFAGNLLPGDDSRYSDVAWSAVELVAPVDSDQDGLPDVWEQDYFGSLAEDADGDPDGDGHGNLEEYLSRTIPSDSKSRLVVAGTRVIAGLLEISWEGRAGVSYQVERTESLGAGTFWTRLGEPIPGYEGLVHQEITRTAASAYYRITATP
ncbi:MAG: PD40 domain-containing protein [Verrucomicrobiae bacterium]|nr:PD40 domain-containing protein [Verrucomicrobiae bacterium]